MVRATMMMSRVEKVLNGIPASRQHVAHKKQVAAARAVDPLFKT
jgi:hypothetical protein